MDKDSINYSSSATSDDGTCRYEGDVVVWYGQYTASQLVNDGASTLTYYLNGSIVGSTAASIYWTSRPNCGANASITITKDLGGSKGKSYLFSVKDQRGNEYWSGVLNFSANTCESLELTW